MSRFGLIGTITSDHVIVEDRPPLRSLGGILYQAAVLCGLGEDVALFSNCGEELRGELDAAVVRWRTLDRAGVTYVPGPGNQVHLHYSDRLKEREEVLASAVPALDPASILAALPRLDMLLMAFNSGFEFALADWRRIVDAACALDFARSLARDRDSNGTRTRACPIWLDVHSFVLDRIVGAHRDYVSVPEWRDWLAGVTYLQANRQEVASLRGHPERWPERGEIESFAAEAFAVAVRAVFVTMGKDGVLMLTPGEGPGEDDESPARAGAGISGAKAGLAAAAHSSARMRTAVKTRQIQAPAADRIVDTTGCGDVFCARTMSLLAKGAALEMAVEAGVILASKAVGLAGIGETFRLAGGDPSLRSG